MTGLGGALRLFPQLTPMGPRRGDDKQRRYFQCDEGVTPTAGPAERRLGGPFESTRWLLQAGPPVPLKVNKRPHCGIAPYANKIQMYFTKMPGHTIVIVAHELML